LGTSRSPKLVKLYRHHRTT